MTIDEKYMSRCLQLALNGKGHTSPNPMVGAVVVHKDTIIGEGYHRQYGKGHAEVNAINSVKDKSLLKDSTIYVSLEPCSHYGKTPPCSQLIIDHQIPRVVVACLDPYPEVSGRGIKMLKDAGTDVTVGILEHEAIEINKEFFTIQTKNRPYVYLKWAQTKDGFIDKKRNGDEPAQPTPISNDFTRMLVHKKRAEVDAIMIGTNTAVNDNPSLTTRFWHGENPTRIILDRQGRIPSSFTIFDGNVKTIVFTEKNNLISSENVIFKEVTFNENLVDNIFSILKNNKITSIMIEGGSTLLQSIIAQGLWDEAYVEIAPVFFEQGVKAPTIDNSPYRKYACKTSEQLHYKNFR